MSCFQATSRLISAAVTKRKNGTDNSGVFDWAELVDQALNDAGQESEITEGDKKARQEKAVALQEIYRSKISVLISAAETGKSTLLVVIDECSMLTEEQLAALLDSVKGMERLVLVGNPKQLPLIGVGRPYFDIGGQSHILGALAMFLTAVVDSLFGVSA